MAHIAAIMIGTRVNQEEPPPGARACRDRSVRPRRPGRRPAATVVTAADRKMSACCVRARALPRSLVPSEPATRWYTAAVSSTNNMAHRRLSQVSQHLISAQPAAYVGEKFTILVTGCTSGLGLALVE